MMPTLTELHLVQWSFPLGALVMLCPIVLTLLAGHRQRQLASYADPHLLPWAVSGDRLSASSPWRRLAEWVVWALLALAAAGPRMAADAGNADGGLATTRHGIDVMVVLDSSASMAATDIGPDRLSRARLKLTDLLTRLRGERLGLLLYAGQAGLMLPSTDDTLLFQRALAQAGPDLLEAPGTDLAAALNLAYQALSSNPVTGKPRQPQGRAVLLVTDAETSSLEGPALDASRLAVEQLRTAGIPLFVWVMARHEGAAVPLPAGALATQDGEPVISHPDVAGYERLATRTRGMLAMVADGDADWQRLYDGGIARVRAADLPAEAAHAWREFFMWPLSLALVLLMWLQLGPAARHKLNSVVLLAGILVTGFVATLNPSPAQAANATPNPPSEVALSAAKAWRAGEWSQALPLFERQGGYAGHMGAGAVAWKMRDFTAAAQHFSNALLLASHASERDDALYNLGNAHFALERWSSAAQAWQAVLISRPGDTRAAANLVHAQGQLAKRRGVTPMKSDLRGRRGFIAEGLVNVDGAVPLEMDESLRLPDAPQTPVAVQANNVSGARLLGSVSTTGVSIDSPDPQRLQSGLVKMDRLPDRSRQLLRGLLKQDKASSAPTQTGQAPW